MSWGGNKKINHRGRRGVSQRAQRLCASLYSPDNYRDSVISVVKKIMILLVFSICLLNAASLDEGNSYLKKGEYDEAIQSYESILEEGYVGHELFFNLGTAYSKKGNIPLAILNFEKALRMKPLDAATKQQLVQLNLKLQDKPVIYDDSGLLAFFNKVQFSMGIDAWALLSIFLMMLVPTVIFISYKFKTLKSRKIIFMSSILWFLLSGFSVVMARNNYHYKYLHTEGIVMPESAVIYDKSNTSSKIKFSVHQGTKLEISDSTDQMFEVEYSSDNGWILREAVKKIEL